MADDIVTYDTSIYGDNELEAGDPYGGDPFSTSTSDNLNLSDYFKSLPSDVSGSGSLSDIIKGIGSLFAGTSSLGKGGQLAGLLGAAALANKMFGSSGGGGYAGYQGGIPSYTASRTMLPIPTTTKTVSPQGVETLVPRRPGSGGITYFSPMTYTLNPSGTTTGTTTGSNTGATTNTTTGGTTGITSGDATIQPTTVSPAPLVPPPPAPSTSSTQTTQSSGATTEVPNTVSSNVVPEDYFRNPVQSSGSLSQIPGASNDGKFLPILKDADWYMTQDLQGMPKDTSRTWRDPVSGYGISVDPYKDVSAAAFTYYDPQGRKLRSSIFNPAELYKNAQEFGIDLSGISELGKKLDAAGVSYKPGQLYAGTGSNLGINFDDIAAKKLGSSYDWTQDPFASQKGPSSVERLEDLQALAQKLGIDLTKSENLATLSPQLAGDVTRQFVVSTPSISGSPTYSWYDTQQAADQAAQQYGGNVINLGGKTIDVPKGARGGIASLSHGIQNGHLGSYSDGGQLLRGPGDGVSDDIPATIADKQPARLADGEFVIPARIVSELGNGSTEAGARKLYAMMDRIKKARRSAKDIAADTKTDRYLPR